MYQRNPITRGGGDYDLDLKRLPIVSGSAVAGGGRGNRGGAALARGGIMERAGSGARDAMHGAWHVGAVGGMLFWVLISRITR